MHVHDRTSFGGFCKHATEVALSGRKPHAQQARKASLQLLKQHAHFLAIAESVHAAFVSSACMKYPLSAPMPMPGLRMMLTQVICTEKETD
jgi:uncharacterized protein YggE